MMPSSPETRQIVHSGSSKTSCSAEDGFCVMAKRQQHTGQSAQNSMDLVFPRLRINSFPFLIASLSSDCEFHGGRDSKSWIKSKFSHRGQMVWIVLLHTVPRSSDLLACENIQPTSDCQISEVQCSTSWPRPRHLRHSKTCSVIGCTSLDWR